MITKAQAEQITKIKKEIAELKKNKSDLQKQQDELSKFGRIASIGDITLYQDRIVGQGQIIKLDDSSLSARVETGGQISYSTETSGGGSRPTLTRIALGAAVAGPIGAVVGGAAQKKKKIKTTTVQHDDRTLRIVITSNSGNIDTGLSPLLESQARSFVTNILNAKANYPKIKKQVTAERQKLTKKLKELEKTDHLANKEKELDKILSKLSSEDRATYEKLEKQINTYFWISLISLIFSYVPIISTIGSIIALIKSNKNKQYGLYEKKIKTTKILSIAGIILSSLMIILMAFYSPNETFTINGQEITIVCENNACMHLEDHSKDATKLLAEIGVRKIDDASKNTSEKTISVSAYDSSTSTTAIELKLQYDTSGKSSSNSNVTVTKIINSEVPEVIYYSNDSSIEVTPFPSLDKVKEIQTAKEEEEKQKAAEAEAEAKAKAIEDAKYPSEGSAQELCHQAFHKMYPYSGSKVHSILGVNYLGRYGENQVIYKVKVTVQNAFGTTYDSIMECIVSRDEGGDIIRIDSLNLY